MRKIFAIQLLLIVSSSSAQKLPELVIQQSLNQVEQVYSSPEGGTYLVQDGNRHILIDQISKLQLGSINIARNSWLSPGNGKIIMLNNFVFLLLQPTEILRVDFEFGIIDTLFNQISFPEFIIDMARKGNSQLVITTKTLPVGKNDFVAFYKTEKVQDEKGDQYEELIYDNTKICRLHVIDLADKKIQCSRQIEENITAVHADTNFVLIGTYDSQIIELNQDLEHLKSHSLIETFNTPIHSIIYLDSCFLILAHSFSEFLHAKAAGSLLFWDMKKGAIHTITLEKEDWEKKNEFQLFDLLPSNRVINTNFDREKMHLWVNYGFSSLARISLNDFEVKTYPSEYPSVNYFDLNRSKTHLFSVTKESVGLFDTGGSLKLYDLQYSKFQSFYKEPDNRQKFRKIHKLFDDEGNYYMLCEKAEGVLEIYPSHSSQSSTLRIECRYLISPIDTAILLYDHSQLYYGKLSLNLLNSQTDTLRFENKWSGKREKISEHPFYKPFPVSHRINANYRRLNNSIPLNISSVFRTHDGSLVVSGSELSRKSKKSAWIIKINNSGNLAYKTHKLVFGPDIVPSPDKKYFAYHKKTRNSDFLSISEASSGNTIHNQKLVNDWYYQNFNFDKNNNVLFYTDFSKNDSEFVLSKIDIKNGKTTATTVAKDVPLFFSFACDMEKNLIATENYNYFRIYSIDSFDNLFEYKPHSTYMKVSNAQNGFIVITDNEHFFYNTSTKDQLLFSVFNQQKPIEILNQRYFRAGKEVLKNLAFKHQNKAFASSDLEVYFNLPSKVLEASGSKNTDYFELLEAVEEKRAHMSNRIPLETVLNSEIELKIQDLDRIEDYTQDEYLSLHLYIGSQSSIASIHVNSNEIPIFGRKGMAFSSQVLTLDTMINIPLSSGINNLEIFAKNKHGLSSPKEYLSVYCNTSTSPTVHFIGIGINQYRQSEYNLKYAVKDIRDLVSALSAKHGNSLLVDTLFDQFVTRDNILALKAKLLTTGVNDKVIVSFSGHGLLDSQYNYYLTTHTTDFQVPSENGMPYEDFEWLLDSIPARKKLLLLDACHSGEVDKEELMAIQSELPDGAKGSELVFQYRPTVGMKNSFELMQELFANVNRGTGATVISAAGGTEFAYEKGNLKNGVFTYSILELMQQQKEIKVSELKTKVGERVTKLTNGLQKPTSRNETIEFDWRVW